MDPTSSTEHYDAAARALLLEVARASVAHGVEHGSCLEVDVAAYVPALRQPKGCFVTLHRAGALRGCVGSLLPRGPLVSEVARCAYRAAFGDPRFPPLTAAELDGLDIHISTLSAPVQMEFSSEADLLSQLRPGVDGVTLRARGRVGTFLPDVWEQLPDPRAFLRQLRVKAGLPGDYWSDALVVERYTTEGF